MTHDPERFEPGRSLRRRADEALTRDLEPTRRFEGTHALFDFAEISRTAKR
jgi:hypothetical protein